jgi:hypothetical protein
MSLLALTAESLGQQVGEPVPPAYVIVAKNAVLGLDDESIRDILGCEAGDLAQVKADPLYEKIRLIVAATHAQTSIDQSSGWDHLENLYLKRLIERAPLERDPEFLLRAAMVANKAQRRVGHSANGGTLNPAERNGRTAITLTRTLVQRIQQGGRVVEAQQSETRQLNISDGSIVNPSFDEVDQLLAVSDRTPPRPGKIQTQTAEPTLDDLTSDLQERFG